MRRTPTEYRPPLPYLLRRDHPDVARQCPHVPALNTAAIRVTKFQTITAAVFDLAKVMVHTNPIH